MAIIKRANVIKSMLQCLKTNNQNEINTIMADLGIKTVGDLIDGTIKKVEQDQKMRDLAQRGSML